jgi:hypothetical protein
MILIAKRGSRYIVTLVCLIVDLSFFFPSFLFLLFFLLFVSLPLFFSLSSRLSEFAIPCPAAHLPFRVSEVRPFLPTSGAGRWDINLFPVDDLQDCLPEGVHSSLFADDSALWVHSPRKEEAVPVLQEGVGEVYRWVRAKKLTLNLKKCEVSFFSADPHEAKWRPVVEVEGTCLMFNPNPLFLGVELGRSLSGNKNGQPLSGAKQFRCNQFSTSADFLFLLLFSKQSRRNQFSK